MTIFFLLKCTFKHRKRCSSSLTCMNISHDTFLSTGIKINRITKKKQKLQKKLLHFY